VIETILPYIHIYLTRPTVVAVDLLILSVAVTCGLGIFILKRKVDALTGAIRLLNERLDRDT